MDLMLAGHDALAIARQRGTQGNGTRRRLQAAAARLGLPNRAALFFWYGQETQRARLRGAIAREQDALRRLPAVERYGMRYVPLAAAVTALRHVEGGDDDAHPA